MYYGTGRDTELWRRSGSGTTDGRMRGEGEGGGRRIGERERWEVGELAKINIPYRAIASDNVDDRPGLARQKASFSNDGEKPMTTLCNVIFARNTAIRGRRNAD